ncbi:ABC transporter permease [Arthrobacter sp. UM1]|uniref:ABC transporter permease n=1 Tax=Arthrobacter sp. UM1 TaxID=2766776 RepID=UPI001CF6782C|nr:ABC transporter permease [Arthrobacter sp. UM1]MCB4208414.1 ABC transporter permease [Arthrobacter sp. UM1]
MSELEIPTTTAPARGSEPAPRGEDAPRGEALRGDGPRAAEPARSKDRSPAALAWRRFWSNLGARFALILLALIFLAVFLGPLVFGLDPDAQDLKASLTGPSAAHPLGTDLLGRDELARLFAGGQVSLLVGLATAASALALGTLIGVVAGMAGGVVDSVLMRITDVFMAIPSILVVIVAGGILGPSIPLLVGLIAAFAWPTSARIARSVVLSVRELDYVQASVAAGTRTPTVMMRHLLPAVIPQVTVSGAMLVSVAILTEAALSFLGLGVVPPQASWGNMLQSAQSYTILTEKPWLWLSPGIAIVLTSLSVIFIGDGLRDALDPKESR